MISIKMIILYSHIQCVSIQTDRYILREMSHLFRQGRDQLPGNLYSIKDRPSLQRIIFFISFFFVFHNSTTRLLLTATDIPHRNVEVCRIIFMSPELFFSLPSNILRNINFYQAGLSFYYEIPVL